MIIYPAIDIRGGKCVRLIQGDFSRETVFLEDPTAAAKKWQNQGAKWIHVVDLDGAKSGIPGNVNVIKKIRETVDVNIQVGGGIRDISTVENYITSGIDRIIFGSSAVKDITLIKHTIEKYGTEKVAVGVDTRENQVAIHGWTKTSGVIIEEMLNQLKTIGVKTVIYTDISKDGMMKGPNISGIEKVLNFDGFSVIASGGISSMADLEQLVQYEVKGLDGAIIGKALYNGILDLRMVLERFSIQDGSNGL
ncbi:MAG TPA: 1-(5-phosphoribosyl)-5-[(5-phosphoribosylamino)methylideneamino]imidazole-4-carboxamide isomerase [Thermoanaerobacterales bacterium]|jgi:phosphoribosylformimino-5-aminoimidazole carboxamide ribotide isomerase|nr:1-(5-phosphoribosyl)-5-[(5-phosphoribosylamino)methylideneamino]imidazole-4-carboxamide isomerase [Thermoanaerobacterales bacterium]